MAERIDPWRVKVISLVPEAFPGILSCSVTGNALRSGFWQLETIDLREFGVGKHRNVDGRPAGGGAGMVLRPDVVAAALEHAAEDAPGDRAIWPVVCLSPRGRPFRQQDAIRWSGTRGMTLLCGRFEGIDERIAEEFDLDEISIGDFVLSGGEIAAHALIDATVRLIPRVLGNRDSAAEDSFTDGLLEYPQYTNPGFWRGRHIPELLVSGNHARIAEWRRMQSESCTRDRRPDLWYEYCALRGMDPGSD